MISWEDARKFHYCQAQSMYCAVALAQSQENDVAMIGPVVITDLQVMNFKALEDASVPLLSLGILTGANSAGKSSILQSLMLAVQSVAADRLLLNGPLVRLGQPEDVIRDGTDSLSLRFRIKSLDRQSRETSVFEVKTDLKVRGNELKLANLSVQEDGVELFTASDTNLNSTDVQQIMKLGGFDQILHLKKFRGKRAAPRTYITFNGLTPDRLVSEFKREGFIAYFSSIPNHNQAALELRDYFLESPGLASQINPSGQTLESIFSWTKWRELETMNRDAYQDLLAQVADQAVNLRWDQVPLRHWYWRPTSRLKHWGGGTQKVDISAPLASFWQGLTQLVGRVKYLGPLRDEPRVLSPSGSLTDFVPAGIRGEYAADLLSLQGDTDRSAVLPSGEQVTGESLRVLVSAWMQYLGLGDHVAVEDLGKLGKGIRLSLDGAERDLTMVGVGASQVLPVLLLTLAAEPGSIVLLEQPELHLHPAVQSRLGDFLSTARPDVNFLVETHSEYMVTRLRLRVAEAKIDPSRIKLMFAERSKEGTQFKQLDFNDVGSLQDWPVGFFDDHERDSERIIAAIARRVKEKRNAAHSN